MATKKSTTPKTSKKKTPKNPVIYGYKGYDKNMQCRGKQYETGNEYEENGALACHYGIHFCENPLDVFSYYPINQGNRYTTVESTGEVSRNEKEDSKVASTKVKIGLEINLKTMIEGAVKFIFSKTKSVKNTKATTGYKANAATTGKQANAATTGKQANAATTGEQANAATTGYKANAATTGNYANAATTGKQANAAVKGKESIAAALGFESAAKGVKGSWLVLADWGYDNSYNPYIKSVQTIKVDGETIKEDTYYRLKNGRFVEVW